MLLFIPSPYISTLACLHLDSDRGFALNTFRNESKFVRNIYLRDNGTCRLHCIKYWMQSCGIPLCMQSLMLSENRQCSLAPMTAVAILSLPI